MKTLTPHAHHGRQLTSTAVRRQRHAQSPQVPFCSRCQSDEYLIVESYTPPRVLRDGTTRAASASYTCGRCEQFSGHEVPSSWQPPGWFWYA
ncbi:hypothetical protein KIH31_11020 [Paenarthrobacter sp. DKR-5]|uniref:hypothetical protein n=1 Tax=Paenarthrobacter sp. DKR-5 TaxID=2835535 RepID=UPI001BDD2C35|nr:hypothetical protein [Paenarthrobacter sp. DKR-5]MBT1003138.1 hypothetical protein [Paenarthrobacter sp. DKR-5]